MKERIAPTKAQSNTCFNCEYRWGPGWGENGYFRVSQREANGRYGLFGMLSHGIIPTDAKNVTDQVYEESPDDDDDELDWWVYLLIGIAALCLLCCICGLVLKVFGIGGK